MIKMTYQQTRGGFNQALMKLSQIQLPVKVSYNVKKLVDEFRKLEKRMADDYSETVLKPHATKDEKGEYVKSKDGFSKYDITDDKQEAISASTEKFGETEFAIDRNKLSLADFMNVNISAADLSALDPIFFDPTEEKVADVTVIPKKA